MKKLALFDMDGTLTEPRQKMGLGMEIALSRLQQAGIQIGIITGSDMNYVMQQCSSMFDLSVLNTPSVHFLPCNGTKYIYNSEMVYESNMKDYVGEEEWQNLIKFLLQEQLKITNSIKIPLTGHFINYRGSMINWCPIGRNADNSQREEWKQLNKNNNIRFSILDRLEEAFKPLGLTTKYGGSTSFDIFPIGWDKTYPIEQTDLFDDFDEIMFVGDSYKPDGNDYELLNHPRIQGFKTDNPKKTMQIVNKILSSTV